MFVRSQQRGSCRLIRAAATKPSAFSRLRFSGGHVKRDGLFRALFPRSRARRLRQTEINSQDAKLSSEPRNRDEADYAKIIEKADRCRDAMQYAEAAEGRGGRSSQPPQRAPAPVVDATARAPADPGCRYCLGPQDRAYCLGDAGPRRNVPLASDPDGITEPTPNRWASGFARLAESDGEPVGQGSADAQERCEHHSSSICQAADPRKPSGPAIDEPRCKAGYTTARAGFAGDDPKSLQGGAVQTRHSAPAAPRQYPAPAWQLVEPAASAQSHCPG